LKVFATLYSIYPILLVWDITICDLPLNIS
jgi:hypothetical protein